MMVDEAKMLTDEECRRILKHRARILAQHSSGELIEGRFLQLLTFALGPERFGVDISFVQEVQPLGKQMWTLVPCTPAFIVGAANIRGHIYSIMHIGHFLGLESPLVPDTAHLILVRGSDGDGKEPMELCIVTDTMPEMVKVPLDSMHPAASTVSPRMQEYVHGVTEDMLTVLDLERLLSEPRIIVNEEV